MIGLDANIVVRAFVTDDPAQAATVARLVAGLTPERPGYINLITLAETIWVLRRVFGFGKARLIDAVTSLLSKPDVRFEKAEIVTDAVEIYRDAKADLTDIIVALANQRAGCETTVTFDRSAGTLTQMTLAEAPQT